MKVLQILPELNVGGVERGTVDFAKYLLAHGHQALVVSHGGDLVKDLEQSGVVHYQLPVHQKNFFTAFKSVRQLRKIILDEQVDIVHARSRVPAWIAFWACRGTKAAFITTCHGHYSNHFLSRIMGWAKLVIVPSQVIGQHMVETFKVPPKNIRVVPRSVDVEQFHRQRSHPEGQSEFVVSNVGRLTPLKGHIYFLKAMAKVVRVMPYVKVWVIGDAPVKKESYRRELELAAQKLGLSGHVEFLGNRRDIPQLLARTDVLVLSTVTQEAFGRVILEAQSAGAAVVATRVGGVTEIIDDGVTGFLVPPKDPEAMANQVMRLLKDRKLSERFNEAAKKKIKDKYTLEHMAGETLKVYDELRGLMNILVIKLSALGDVVLVTASLKALRQKFPRARIHCLVGKKFQAALQGSPFVDEIIPWDEETYRGWPGILKFSRRLRRYQFDKIIDFQNNRKSHWLAFLSCPRESFGYRQKFGFLLTHPIVDAHREMPPVLHQFQILEKLEILPPDDLSLQLWPSPMDNHLAQTLLDSEWLGNVQNIVGINLAASEKWGTKNWPIEHIARLCDILSAKNIRVILTGMEKDRDLVRNLLQLAKSKPSSFVGKTENILQLAALIRRCKVYVTPDSAPLHVSAAVGTPFVAFFGPTDSRRHLPPSKRFTVFEKDLPCIHCYSPECKITTHACMKDITPEDVAKAVQKLMAK